VCRENSKCVLTGTSDHEKRIREVNTKCISKSSPFFIHSVKSRLIPQHPGYSLSAKKNQGAKVKGLPN